MVENCSQQDLKCQDGAVDDPENHENPVDEQGRIVYRNDKDLHEKEDRGYDDCYPPDEPQIHMIDQITDVFLHGVEKEHTGEGAETKTGKSEGNAVGVRAGGWVAERGSGMTKV